jgi:hypothetical protein
MYEFNQMIKSNEFPLQSYRLPDTNELKYCRLTISSCLLKVQDSLVLYRLKYHPGSSIEWSMSLKSRILRKISIERAVELILDEKDTFIIEKVADNNHVGKVQNKFTSIPHSLSNEMDVNKADIFWILSNGGIFKRIYGSMTPCHDLLFWQLYYIQGINVECLQMEPSFISFDNCDSNSIVNYQLQILTELKMIL